MSLATRHDTTPYNFLIPSSSYQASSTQTKNSIKVKLLLSIKLNELALRWWRKEGNEETLGPRCKLSLTPTTILNHPHHPNPKSQHKTHQNLEREHFYEALKSDHGRKQKWRMRGERGGSLTYEISSNSKKKLNNKVSHSLIVGCLGKETSEIRVFYVVVQFGVMNQLMGWALLVK